MLEFILAIVIIVAIPMALMLLIIPSGRGKAGNPPSNTLSKVSRSHTGYWREPPHSFSSFTSNDTKTGSSDFLPIKESTDNPNQ